MKFTCDRIKPLANRDLSKCVVSRFQPRNVRNLGALSLSVVDGSTSLSSIVV